MKEASTFVQTELSSSLFHNVVNVLIRRSRCCKSRTERLESTALFSCLAARDASVCEAISEPAQGNRRYDVLSASSASPSRWCTSYN